MVKRILVTFNDEQYEIIEKLRVFGTKESERIRNIVLLFLSEKGYLKKDKKE